MATITKKHGPGNNLGSTPWGNLSALHFALATTALGAAVSADSTSPLKSGDVVQLGVLPAGFTLADSTVVVSTGMTATVTGKLGFAYVDGVDDAKVPQDDDYFGAALNLAAAARLRNATSNAPVTLQKDAWLTLTIGGADNAKEARIDVVIPAIAKGAV